MGRGVLSTGLPRPAWTPPLATAGVALASLGFALVPLFTKPLAEAGLASPAIALWRFALVALTLAPLWVLTLTPAQRVPALWAAGAGALLGVGWIGYVEAVQVASVASTAVIYMSYPLFTLVLAWAVTRRRPSARAAIGAVVILAAAILALAPELHATVADARSAPVSSPSGGASAGEPVDVLAALLLSITAPASFGAAIVILTTRLQALSPVQRCGIVAMGSVIGLLPLVLGLEPAVFWPRDWETVGLLAGIAVLTALVPQLLYVTAAPHVGPARAAATGSIELPAMFAVGLLAFGEPITLLQALAGLLVLGAMVLTPAAAPPPAVPPGRGPD